MTEIVCKDLFYTVRNEKIIEIEIEICFSSSYIKTAYTYLTHQYVTAITRCTNYLGTTVTDQEFMSPFVQIRGMADIRSHKRNIVGSIYIAMPPFL